MTKTPQKSSYVAKVDGWVAGQRVKAGDELSLTAAAARYEPVEPKKPSRPARSTRNDATEGKASTQPTEAGA